MPNPDILVTDIIEHLEAGLESLREIMVKLNSKEYPLHLIIIYETEKNDLDKDVIIDFCEFATQFLRMCEY